MTAPGHRGRRPPGADGTSPGPAGSAPDISVQRRARIWLIVGAVLVVVSLGVGLAIWLSGGPAAPPTAGVAAVASAPAGSSSSGASASASASQALSASPSASKTPAKPPNSQPAPVVGPPVGGAWPNAGNTGVPAGTQLSTYTGPCQITQANTVVDARIVNCDLDVRAANVTIKRSRINGSVDLDTDIAGSDKWSYTLVDSEVNAGVRQLPAVSYGNMTVLRSNIHGGETSVQCGEKAISCTVQDSWLHGQLIPSTANWHLGGFLSNGGHNIRIRHNTIVCDAPANSVNEGCTGDLNLFGDFAVVSDVIADSNFLGANTGSSFCLYGGDAPSKKYPHADHVVITNNVFERGTNNKCGDYGPVSSFNVGGPGNVWANNTWDKGGTVGPEM